MTDKGTWPPYDMLDEVGTYHWLVAERVSRPTIAQWMGNAWATVGEAGLVTPQDMHRRGWEYHSPAKIVDQV